MGDEFSFSVQSLMNRLVFRCAYASCEVWMNPHQGVVFWFSFGNFIFSLDTNARAFPVMMYRLLCANSRQ